MYFLKIFLTLFVLVILSSCATTNAPDGWLPKAEDIPTDTYGAWCTLNIKVNSRLNKSGENVVAGELIAIDDSSIYLLNDVLLDRIPQRNILKSVIELDRKHYEYGIHTSFGTLSTISHGLVSIITAPMWILFGWPVAIGETYRDRYLGNPPDNLYWNTVRKFSRYPQGISSDVDYQSLKLKAKQEMK